MSRRQLTGRRTLRRDLAKHIGNTSRRIFICLLSRLHRLRQELGELRPRAIGHAFDQTIQSARFNHCLERSSIELLRVDALTEFEHVRKRPVFSRFEYPADGPPRPSL